MKTDELLKKAGTYREQAEELLKSFKQNIGDASKVWDELVFCLCTPQTKAVNALKACEQIKKLNGYRADEVADVLRRCGVRFHNNKARYIAEAVKQFPVIYEKIRNSADASELRKYLVKNVKGFGYKEASHFLRNIGFENVAIIDRHVLKYMAANRLLPRKYRSVTARRYLSAERKFINHAKKLGLSPCMLDLLIWAVSTGRVVK